MLFRKLTFTLLKFYLMRPLQEKKIYEMKVCIKIYGIFKLFKIVEYLQNSKFIFFLVQEKDHGTVSVMNPSIYFNIIGFMHKQIERIAAFILFRKFFLETFF